jgi:hypothetical protein
MAKENEMAGQWQSVNKQPGFNAGLMLLLTDACVLCQERYTKSWWKLAPDERGQYSDSVWVRVADAPFAPLWFASAVLRDGRVFIAGGEYAGGGANTPSITTDFNGAIIYDPVEDRWTTLGPPAFWTSIGDAPCCVLVDGRVLIGSIDQQDCAIFDPDTNGWTTAAKKLNANSNEETWTLLRDDTVLTVECKGPSDNTPSQRQTERYLRNEDRWIPCGQTVRDLVETASFEIGPALLLPDGRCFCVGANGNTGIYVPPAQTMEPGTWLDGPTLPRDAQGRQLGAKDAPACLLPNGKILLAIGPVNGNADDYLTPTYFYEFDPNASGGANQFTALPLPAGKDPDIAPFNWSMLLLPTGDVMLSNGQKHIKIYHPDGAPIPEGKPVIDEDSAPTKKRGDKTTYRAIQPGESLTLRGRKFNGLSQAVSYGDDAAMATNYPLVRLKSKTSGRVRYCRTFGHSSMGVATGYPVSTNFAVPEELTLGAYELRVVVNGIQSEPLDIVVE